MSPNEHDHDAYDLEPSAPAGPARPPTEPAPALPQTTRLLADEHRSRQALRAKMTEDAVRDSYRTPLIMLAIGAGSVVLLQLLLGAGFVGVLAYLASYAVSVPLGVGVFLLCCMLWIGFDAPVHLTALRLAGIYAVTDLSQVLCAFIPGFGLALMFVVPAFVYIGLLAQLLEIELLEAIVVGLLTFIVKVAVAIMIVGWVA